MDQAQLLTLQDRLRAILAEQFEVGELLGAGGFAAVFRARDRLLGRDVAIKVLDPSLSLAPGAAERLLDEARLVASIEHPHIVPLYEAGQRDGIVFLVIRYFPDGTAGDRLNRAGAWPAAEVARLGVEAADALAAAHARGIVHLDIKPDNILMDGNGHAAVADFGIARAIAGSGATGRVSGTPHYMSPEQVAGDQLDGRTDVYALGVVLYELATGQRPVVGTSAQEIMANQVRQAPRPLAQAVPDLPGPLARVITRALEKDPGKRWASAADMAAALRAASAPDQLVSPRMAARRTRRRWYVRGAMVGCGLLAGLALIGYGVVRLLSTLGKGNPPSIDAHAPGIPPALLDSALAGGRLTPGDTVLYIFAPYGKGMDDGLVVTRRDIIVLRAGTRTRYPIVEDYDLDLKLTPDNGYLIIRPPSRASADTVYRELSGLELQALNVSLKRVFAVLSR